MRLADRLIWASRLRVFWRVLTVLAPGLMICCPGCSSGNTENPSGQLTMPSSDTAQVAEVRGAGQTPVGAPFPELGQPQSFGSSVDFYRVTLIRSGKSPMRLNIFVPKGNHAAGSLPVVMEAPSGTPLLHGADIKVPRPNTEYLPFTEAGMITVSYPIDGKMPPGMGPQDGPAFMLSLSQAYKEFVAADAGVDNGKLAIDYVLAKLPMADSKRLYTWGHSSAATLALLLASKDHRVTKCIALAPSTDLVERLGELREEREMSQFLPDLDGYLKNGSPIHFIEQLRCPVYVAHARDDDNVPYSQTTKYVEALQNAGADVTFQELTQGGHYKPLLDAAIPPAIEWLKR